MPRKLKTAVLGATGYSGYELARLLLRHPRLDKPLLFRRPSENGDGGDLAKLFPALSGNGGFPLQPFSWEALKEVDLLFLATPHNVSRSLAPEAVGRGMRVIDLSGAWRLKQPQHRSVYGFHDSDAAAAEELPRLRVAADRPVHAREGRLLPRGVQTGHRSRLLAHL